MKARSLFSGVGGMDLGLERAGIEIVSQCEKESYRRDVLARHWPDAEVSDDVESVSYEAGSCDLLVGGFPCQDLSVAGRRRGLAGARSGLFFEFARIADECVPDGGWILIENVPGLLSSHGGRDFGVLLSTLVDLGFHDIAWRVLDSRYFGVPQRRRRVFILARRSAGQRAAQVLSEPEGDGGHPQEGRKKGSKRPRAAADGAGDRRGAALAGGGEDPAVGGLTRRYGKGTDSDATDAMVVGFNLRGREGGSQPEVDPDGLASLRASNGGSSRTYIASALDKMRGGADDNDAQANHVIPVGLSTQETGVSGTLGKKGVGGGGLGLDREGAFVINKADGRRTPYHTDAAPNNPTGTVVAFNWQSGGDVRLGVTDDHIPTLQKEQVPAVHAVGVLGDHAHALTSEGMDASEDGTGRGTPIVHVIVAPEVAAPLTRGHAAGAGVSVPGRRMEDDKNLVAFGAWNMKVIEDVSGPLLGGSKGNQYSLNNMPLVAKCLTATPGRWDYDTEDFVVHAEDTAQPVRTNPFNNSDAATESKQHVMVRPRAVADGAAVSENQRAEVRETPFTFSATKGGGKPGQGYAAARVVDFDPDSAPGLVRRLTPTECERLQGFPDGWTLLDGDSLADESSWYEVGVVQTEGGAQIIVPRISDPSYLDRLLASLLGGYEVEEPKPDGRRYAAMGDAVTVPVAHWIGARLLKFGTD